MNKDKKHSHGEAFMWMTYYGKNGPNEIKLTIWNSRDGVTPFMTFSREYGIQLRHQAWHSDIYKPDYKPKKGDLIWVSHTKESATKSAEESYKMHCEVLEELRKKEFDPNEYDTRPILEEMVSDKQEYINKAIEQMLFEHGEPQPHLLLVEEDWK